MKTAIMLFIIFMSISAYGQIAINTDGSSPDTTAILDVKSTDKGLLVPRLAQIQIEALTSPADGLLVFCTTDEKFYVYVERANEWKSLDFGAGTIQAACGTPLFDSRDGKAYSTKLIGIQCWMAENLNVGTMIPGIFEQNPADPVIEKYCYQDLDVNCDTLGGLYQWDEMMQNSIIPGIQGICPAGWHLPEDIEWIALATTLGGFGPAGAQMKQTGFGFWFPPNSGANNTSGFTGLGGGHRHNAGYFELLKLIAHFWSSTQDANNLLAWQYMLFHNNTALGAQTQFKTMGLSVRCLRD